MTTLAIPDRGSTWTSRCSGSSTTSASGNRARVHLRESENRQALLSLFRTQDQVAAEVAQAYAQAQSAAGRTVVMARGLRAALASADRNLAALNETKPVGGTLQPLVRPQEAVAAVQALAQAFVDYYAAIADANRAQFRLYRALGQPAHLLLTDEACRRLTLPCPAVRNGGE
jgi:hypothetical protein